MIGVERVITALALPEEARVDQRVPKNLLMEQGTVTAADRKKIKDGIDSLHWIAVLKSGNLALPAFRDGVREYAELVVIHAALRPRAKTARLSTLIHRAIPYPLVLLTTDSEGVTLSLVHKRHSQKETGGVMLDGEVIRERLSSADGVEGAFLDALALSRQQADDLFDLYRLWSERLETLTAARITGTFRPSASVEKGRERRRMLRDHAEGLKKLAGLRARAAGEKQLNRRVALNVEIQGIQTKLNDLTDRLRE